MLSGATWSAAAMVGTPVLRIVVSSDSMKNATAISQGSSCLLDVVSDGGADGDAPSFGAVGLRFVGLAGIGDGRHGSSWQFSIYVCRKFMECIGDGIIADMRQPCPSCATRQKDKRKFYS